MIGGTFDMTTVIMTDEDAERFKVFLEHYNMMSLVATQLPMKSGSITLHFDKDGVLKGIKKDFWSYQI